MALWKRSKWDEAVGELIPISFQYVSDYFNCTISLVLRNEKNNKKSLPQLKII